MCRITRTETRITTTAGGVTTEIKTIHEIDPKCPVKHDLPNLPKLRIPRFKLVWDDEDA
jgi:hypothetical protein